MPARKFFVIPVDDLSRNKREKRQSVLISDDEEEDLDDFVVKPPKKFKAKSSSQMEEMHRDIQQISRNLECIFKLTKNTKLPPGLYKLLSDTFQCQICRAMPIVPPPIYTRCCKRILGCQTCVDRWYCGTDSINHSCPICRSERAFTETSQIKGLDDFLNGIRAVFDGESDTVIDDGELAD